jgi:hypothetical protein
MRMFFRLWAKPKSCTASRRHTRKFGSRIACITAYANARCISVYDRPCEEPNAFTDRFYRI